MKTNQVLNNFSSGEWDPRLKGRSESDAYKSACASLKNFLVESGGAVYRGGLGYIPIENGTAKTAIEGHGSALERPMLIPYNHPQTIYTVLLAFFYSPLPGNTCYLLPSGQQPIVDGGLNTSMFSSWQNVTYTQAGEYLIIASSDHEPIVFYFDGINYRIKAFFTLAQDLAAEKIVGAWAYQDIQANDTSVRITPSGTTGAITLTASGDLFLLKHTSRIVKIGDGAQGGFARITGYVSPTVVNATVLAALPSTAQVGGTNNPDSFWQIAAWGPVDIPQTVSQHQGRLVFGGTSTEPRTIWCSRAGNIWQFNEVPSPATTGPFGFANGAYLQDNSRPFSATMTITTGNIQSMLSMNNLFIQTEGDDITVESKTGFGPLDIQFKVHSRFGSAKRIRAQQIQDSVFFATRRGELINLKYSFEQEQYKGTNLSALTRHFQKSKDVYDQIRQPYAMAALDRQVYITTGLEGGTDTFCYSFEESTGVMAWSRIELGKPSNHTADLHKPVIASMVAFNQKLLDQNANVYDRHRVFAMVRPGGTSQGHVLCAFNLPWDLEHPSVHSFSGNISPRHWSPYHLDFLTSASFVSTYVWQVPPLFRWGAINANGVKVHVIADGNYIGEFTCNTDDRITLPDIYTNVAVGLQYEGEIITMPFSEQGQNGPTHGRPRRIHEAVIRFFRTLGGKIGRADQTNLDEIPFRDPMQPMNQPTDFFTGEKKIAFPAGYERDYAVKVVQNMPFPMTVSYIAMNGISYD